MKSLLVTLSIVLSFVPVLAFADVVDQKKPAPRADRTGPKLPCGHTRAEVKRLKAEMEAEDERAEEMKSAAVLARLRGSAGERNQATKGPQDMGRSPGSGAEGRIYDSEGIKAEIDRLDANVRREVAKAAPPFGGEEAPAPNTARLRLGEVTKAAPIIVRPAPAPAPSSTPTSILVKAAAVLLLTLVLTLVLIAVLSLIARIRGRTRRARGSRND